ncbi:MAG: hypothetical protein QOH26_1274 [Actinomycetota bacterium]|jgi:hypothetical protein|nr:hypothetical protein [Actinomycetota bacterium]
MANSVPFEHPSPDQRQAWQTKVRDAIKAKSLKWSPIIDRQWVLSGQCPRCKDEISNYVDLEVLVAETLSKTSFDIGTKANFPTEVVCNCDVEDPHRKATKGCGAGQGLQIEIPVPPSVGA